MRVYAFSEMNVYLYILHVQMIMSMIIITIPSNRALWMYWLLVVRRETFPCLLRMTQSGVLVTEQPEC